MVIHKTLFVADEGSIASLVQLWSVITCMGDILTRLHSLGPDARCIIMYACILVFYYDKYDIEKCFCVDKIKKICSS